MISYIFIAHCLTDKYLLQIRMFRIKIDSRHGLKYEHSKLL